MSLFTASACAQVENLLTADVSPASFAGAMEARQFPLYPFSHSLHVDLNTIEAHPLHNTFSTDLSKGGISTVSAVPEVASAAMVLAGLVSIAGLTRRRI